MIASVDPARRGAGPDYVASGARLNNLPAGVRLFVRVWRPDRNHGLGELTLFGGAEERAGRSWPAVTGPRARGSRAAAIRQSGKSAGARPSGPRAARSRRSIRSHNRRCGNASRRWPARRAAPGCCRANPASPPNRLSPGPVPARRFGRAVDHLVAIGADDHRPIMIWPAQDHQGAHSALIRGFRPPPSGYDIVAGNPPRHRYGMIRTMAAFDEREKDFEAR